MASPIQYFCPESHPFVTLWGGPILGVPLPGMVAPVVRMNWIWFMANFGMMANGVYMTAAWMSGDRYLDALRLLHDMQAAPKT